MRLLIVLAALIAVVQSRAAPRKQEKEGPPVDEPIDTGIYGILTRLRVHRKFFWYFFINVFSILAESLQNTINLERFKLILNWGRIGLTV